MTRSDAVARCAELNRDEAGDRHWFAKQITPDGWEVVSISGTGLRARGPLKETVETRPRPSEPPDPRPSIFRNVPPYGAG